LKDFGQGEKKKRGILKKKAGGIGRRSEEDVSLKRWILFQKA